MRSLFLFSLATTHITRRELFNRGEMASLNLNNILLRSKEKDCSAVYEVAFSYGLYQLEWDDLHAALLRKSSDGLIGKEGFSSFFRERSDDGSEWNTTKNELEERVMGIFDCFDRTGSDFCDVDELTCGLSLFIRGYVQLQLERRFFTRTFATLFSS